MPTEDQVKQQAAQSETESDDGAGDEKIKNDKKEQEEAKAKEEKIAKAKSDKEAKQK